jgi:hypothetical protein
MRDFQIEIDGVVQDDSLCIYEISARGPEFWFDFQVGFGYGWFVGGWERYEWAGKEISDYMLEWRIQNG